MLTMRLNAVIGEDGVAQWTALVAALPADRLYHGTSLVRAERIMQEGFRTSFGSIREAGDIDTYWGRAGVAANFANKAILEQSRPAILSASLADVIASGTPMALRTSCDNVDTEYATWQECYEATGSLWVRGGQYVRGLTLHTI